MQPSSSPPSSRSPSPPSSPNRRATHSSLEGGGSEGGGVSRRSSMPAKGVGERLRPNLKIQVKAGSSHLLGRVERLLSPTGTSPLREEEGELIVSVSPSSVSPQSDCELEKYRVGKVIGEGSTAVVLRGVRISDSQKVAIKKVRNFGEETVEIMKEEFQLLRTIHHFAIISAYDLIATPRKIYLVVELVENALTMNKLIKRRGALPEVACQSLLWQLLSGLDYLHQHRVIHRDIKPQNLLLTKNLTQLKIIDFNTARSLMKGGSLTLTGTYIFCAPEYLLQGEYNERVDVWSCGMVLFFMLTAKYPFSNKDFKSRSEFAEFALHKEHEYEKDEAFDMVTLEGVKVRNKAKNTKSEK